MQIHTTIPESMMELKRSLPGHLRWVDVIFEGLSVLEKRHLNGTSKRKKEDPDPGPPVPMRELTLDERQWIVLGGGTVPMSGKVPVDFVVEKVQRISNEEARAMGFYV